MGLLTDAHGRGVFASRPAAGHAGREYYSTDTLVMYRDNGSSWDAQSTSATRASLGLDTTDSPQFAGINLGHASDTTLARASAGVVSIEGVNIVKAGAATGSGLTMATARLLGRTTASSGAIEELTVGAGLTLSGGVLDADGGGGGSDLVQVASGAGSVRIPGAAGSADIPPASAGSLDDEFDATDTSDPITGWTTVQTPTAIDSNSTVKSHLYIKKTATNASTGHVGVYKAWTPSAAQYVWCKVSDAVVFGTNGNQAGFAFWVSDGTKYEMLRWIWDSTNYNLRVTAYNTVGSPTTDLAGAIGANLAIRPPLYLKVLYNSSTSISWFYSSNGKLWLPALLAHNPSMTISRIGIGLDTQNTATDGEVLFDFVRSSF